jgi:16S rRNA (adenine1518-N6/adenine1519-N6)-dimethyltransferase
VPTLLQQTRFALGELGIRPHKHLGQHFLIDADVVMQMVQAAQLGPETAVLEIGPGLGVVSDVLADACGRLYLVELDQILAGRLEQRFTKRDTVQVVTADFLRLDLSTFVRPSTSPAPTSIHVVASLPYQVATPILFRLLEHRTQFPEATVMLQKEVAERICAAPGTKAYGVLSVLIQLYAEVETICLVEAQSFFPAPKVQSQVIRLVFHTEPRVAVQNEKMFRRLVKGAFGQRRKTLRNALRTAGFSDLEDIAARLKIDLQRRGETLQLEEFAALANAISADGLHDLDGRSTSQETGPDRNLKKAASEDPTY